MHGPYTKALLPFARHVPFCLNLHANILEPNWPVGTDSTDMMQTWRVRRDSCPPIQMRSNKHFPVSGLAKTLSRDPEHCHVTLPTTLLLHADRNTDAKLMRYKRLRLRTRGVIAATVRWTLFADATSRLADVVQNIFQQLLQPVNPTRTRK